MLTAGFKALLWLDYFAKGAKSGHFEVTCYPYKEIHMTNKQLVIHFVAILLPF